MAQLGENVFIGAYSAIGPTVSIGDNVHIHEHVVIKGNTEIESGCEIYPFTNLGQPSQGKHSIQDGTNGLFIGQNTTIRESVSIHSSQHPNQWTRIGKHCLIMGQVHVGHDCQVGNHVVLSQSTGLAGHVQIEDHAILGGMVGVHQYVRIGAHAMIGMMSRIGQDILPYSLVNGKDSKPTGANLVGLKRAGFSPKDRLAIQTALRILTQATLLEPALQELRALQNEHVDRIIQFARSSKRGFLRVRQQQIS